MNMQENTDSKCLRKGVPESPGLEFFLVAITSIFCPSLVWRTSRVSVEKKVFKKVFRKFNLQTEVV